MGATPAHTVYNKIFPSAMPIPPAPRSPKPSTQGASRTLILNTRSVLYRSSFTANQKRGHDDGFTSVKPQLSAERVSE